jgi:hypothetical protein
MLIMRRVVGLALASLLMPLAGCSADSNQSALASTPAATTTATTTATATTTETVTEAATEPATETEIVVFSPIAPGGTGLADSFTIKATATGECWASNVVIRPDAFRCYPDTGTVANEIQDPCFVSYEDEYAPVLYCLDDPTQTEVVKVTPTGGEGGFDGTDPENPTDGSPWAIKLSNGALCTALGGATTVVAGQRLNYGCADGSSLYGEPDRSAPLWRIFCAPEGQQTSTLVGIAAAWF